MPRLSTIAAVTNEKYMFSEVRAREQYQQRITLLIYINNITEYFMQYIITRHFSYFHAGYERWHALLFIYYMLIMFQPCLHAQPCIPRLAVLII